MGIKRQPDASNTKTNGFPGGKRLKTMLTVSLCPLWELIPILREQVEKMLMLLVADYNAVQRIIIAVSELLENGVKYTTAGAIVLSLAFAEDPGRIMVKVTNKSSVRHIRVLKQVVTGMRKADRQTFYIEMLKQRHQRRSMSRKGIARINFECNGRLKMTTTPDRTVQIEVLFFLEERG